MKTNIKTSLIITTYNWKEALKLTLKSVSRQTIFPDEIIIISDTFKEETIDLIDNFSKNYPVPISVYNKVKIDNAFHLCEEVVLKSKYEYLILINGNTILHKNHIHDHIYNAKKGSYVTSQKRVIDYKLASKLYGKANKPLPNIITPNYLKSFQSVFSIFFLQKKSKEFSCINNCGYSFHKDDYKYAVKSQDIRNFSNNNSFIEILKKIGLKRKNLKFSAIKYQIQEKSSNSGSNQKKKIIVSLDRLKLLNCGLGQVALNYGRGLLDAKSDEFEFNFLLPAKGFAEFENKVTHTNLNFFRRFSSNYMKQYDLCHITHQLPSFTFGKARKNVLTIHDLNFVYTKSKQKNKRFIRAIQNSIYKSDAIVFISEFTMNMSLEYLNVPNDKIIRIIYNGVRPPGKYYHRPDWLPDKKFIFSIGQFLLKKNFHVLLPFLKNLPEEYILVIAGENETNYGRKIEQMASDLKLKDRIIFPGGISEEHKSFLYNNCEAFVFPSIAEGFGLPIIEAMLCSKPVFCSDRTSLSEVGDKFAFFWKNFKPDEMLDVFNKGMIKFNEKGYKEKQKEYANTYTYEKNVSQYLKLYKELLQ